MSNVKLNLSFVRCKSLLVKFHFTKTMQPGTVIGFYTIVECIGSGGFGDVYMVKSDGEPGYFAMKIEPLDAKIRTLEFEITVMKRLSNSGWFPKLISSGRDGNYAYLVMELCGPALNHVIDKMPQNQFQISYVYKLADDMLSCIENLHKAGFVHRDIKPDNFVLRYSGSYPLALLDFGISKQYCDRDGNHLEARDFVKIAWSPYYASTNAHKHIELSRRDDMISWIYSVMQLSEFKLPWTLKDPVDKITSMKNENSLQSIVQPLGPEFVEIAKHIESLGFMDTPDYAFIHKQLASKIATEIPYQWMSIKPEGVTIKIDTSANNFDPTGFLISMGHEFKLINKSACLLI